MEISKVKDGTYPAKITSIYATSEKRVSLNLEINVKRKKKVETQVDYYLKKGKNKALMKIIEDMGGLVENGSINWKRLFKCRFLVDAYYDDAFDVLLLVTAMKVVKNGGKNHEI